VQTKSEKSLGNALHDAFTHVLDPRKPFYANAPRHAGWIGARRCADRRGLYFSLSADENERCARGGVECFALRRASEPARDATYPTRGSKLTERTLSERVRVENPTWGADRRQHASPRPVAGTGCSLPIASVGCRRHHLSRSHLFGSAVKRVI